MVASRSIAALSGLLLALLLSGCSASQGAGGQQASANGSLAYQGSSTGTQSDTFSCGGEGAVSVGGQLGSGKLTVTVKDGAGRQVYTKEFSGPGQSADSRTVSGTAGEWTVTAVRGAGSSQFGAGWSGQYGISVGC